MRRKKVFWLSLLAGGGLAAFAAGQIVISPSGGNFSMRDSNYGNVMMVQQLWSHAQMLENEVVQQRKAILELEKDLKEEKEKFTKLERRVRNMELRGK